MHQELVNAPSSRSISPNAGESVDPEKYGQVKRGLKSRHIQFIAIGGTIGTGLFVGSGGALARAGPLSILLGYLIVGTILISVIHCLGEMATFLPIPGGLTVYAKRYVSEDVAFALGINYWFGSAITLCAEVSAAAIVIEYWTTKVNVAVWITIFLVGVLALNIFSVKGYGEGEFFFASLKIITICGLLILAVIIDLGGAPNHHRLGFHFWNTPGPMREYLEPGAAGRFLGFLATFVYAAFAYGGGEVIAVAACEAENPRRNIPRACNRVIGRILVFYIGGVLAIGVLVAYNDPGLAAAIAASTPGAGSSPFVIAIENSGITVLPSIINAVILSSAWSSGNAFLYSGSRNLYALALSGKLPAVFAKCNRNGVPWVAVLVTFAVGLLSYLNVSNSSSVAFGWFSNLTTVSGLFNWAALSYTYLRFRKGCQAQGITDLPFKAMWAPYTGWWAFGSCLFIIIIQGFPVFFGTFSYADFLAAYLGILVFVLPMVIWKAVMKSKLVPYEEMDFVTGKELIDAEEKDYEPVVAKNWLERIWLAIA
jgi:amino acid transporter